MSTKGARASVDTAKAPAVPISRENVLLLGSLAFGHTLMHCLQYGFLILLPPIKKHFRLDDIQYGGIESARSFSSLLVNIPAGAVAALLKRRWAAILASALVGIGVAFFILGAAPNYFVVLVGAALVGVGTSLWHPPALSTLSARMPERLGFALSIHGMGGEIGNFVGPIGMGLLIAAFTWQTASQILIVPLVAVAILLWAILRNIPGRESTGGGGKAYGTALIGLFTNKTVMGLAVARGIEAMGNRATLAFFSLYLQEKVVNGGLGFSEPSAGLYVALSNFLGIFSQPVMGYLSDKVGRKWVIVPSLVMLGVFISMLAWVGPGIGLIAVVLCIGLFAYSLGAIFQAASIDVTDEKTGAMTIALLFASSGLFGLFSPIIAGVISSTYGIRSVFIYGAAMMVLAALIVLVLPLGRAKHHARSH